MEFAIRTIAVLAGWCLINAASITASQQVAAWPMAPVANAAVRASASDMGSSARYESLESSLAGMQAELAQLRQQVASQASPLHSGYAADPGWCPPDCRCSGDSILENPSDRGGFYIGAAALFAKPHFKESFQVSNTNNLTGLMTLVPFEYDYELTPRVWFGFQNQNGLGLRASYWGFDGQGQAATLTTDGSQIWGAHVVNTMFPANIFSAVPGSQMSVSDYLTTKTVNLVGTYATQLASARVLAGAGLRYAKLQQGMDAVVISPAPGDFHQLNWSREFEGLGPTVTVDAKRQLGQSRFSAVASGGGALLYGSKTLQRTVINDQTPAAATPPFLQLNGADEVVGIGELGLGLEWGAAFHNGNSMTLRGVYEGQLWAEAGAPTLGFLGFQGFGFQMELRR